MSLQLSTWPHHQGPEWLLAEGLGEFGEMLFGPAPEQHQPEQLVAEDDYHRALACAIDVALGSLTARECDVIRARYGLTPYAAPVRLVDCEAIFGICRERVRQIQSRAERRLGDPAVARDLVVFALGGTVCECGHGWRAHHAHRRSRVCAYRWHRVPSWHWSAAQRDYVHGVPPRRDGECDCRGFIANREVTP